MAKRPKKEEPEVNEAPEVAEESAVEAVAEKAPAKSIVDPKYRDKYKGEDAKDFVSKFIESQCVVKSEDGKSSTFEVENLFKLATAHGYKEAKLAALRSQAGGRGYIPRMRMTLGNVLRAAARKRYGLTDLDGNFHEIDEDFKTKQAKLIPVSPTHNPDGSRIPKVAKPANTEGPAPEAA